MILQDHGYLAKLWEVNVGHKDSYVLFDLQLFNGVHFQVRSAEATGGLRREKRYFVISLHSGINLITLGLTYASAWEGCIPCVCVRVSFSSLYVLSASITHVCRVRGLVNQSQASL